MNPSATTGPWPDLPFLGWADTRQTLHMWLQVVGKVRLACSPWVNHQWHVTLYDTSRGLSTGPIPSGRGLFQIDFDFLDHVLRISGCDGAVRTVELRPRSVADFYHEVMHALREMGVGVEIHGVPNEVVDPVPFAEDDRPGSYDPEYANRFWRALSSSSRVFADFRGRFTGKCSPVHFFWGAMDLAVTRFSGRPAPDHPGGIPNLPDWVTREAYSHEVCSAGFWPGDAAYPNPIFYAYAYPSPEGFADGKIRPDSGRWEPALSEFVLPYEAVSEAASPDEVLMAFLESTYEVAADLGNWDRRTLEWADGERPPPGGWSGRR